MAEPSGALRSAFGDRWSLAERYAAMLRVDGVQWGVIGPHESAQVWTRHIGNCAAVAELIPAGSVVIDIGSGAGLPGIVLALVDPSLRVTLLEPVHRRVEFLHRAVAALGLGPRVQIRRGRVPDAATGLDPAQIVVARAVAPLYRLAPATLPLVAPDGHLLAIKGAGAGAEVEAAREELAAAGAAHWLIRRCGHGMISPMTTVIDVHKRAVVTAAVARPDAHGPGRRHQQVRRRPR